MSHATQGDTPVQGDTGVQGDTPPSLLQVVTSAYGWGIGELEEGEIVPEASCEATATGDSLLDFLLRETCIEDWDDDQPEATEADRWEEARYRMTKVLAEVQSVYDAVHRYGPQ